MSDKIIRYSNRADFVSLLAHIFCCGIPALSSALAMLSAAGLTGTVVLTQVADVAHHWHDAIFAFSTVMVMIAVAAFVIARRRDCVTEGHCHHEPCAPKKRTSWKRLAVSLILYAFNLAVFFGHFATAHA